jgi:hypothetical protein
MYPAKVNVNTSEGEREKCCRESQIRDTLLENQRDNLQQRASVFCFLSSLPLLPPATKAVLRFYLSSLHSQLPLYRRCSLAYPYDGRGFVGAHMKTSVGLLVFNPLWYISYKHLYIF